MYIEPLDSNCHAGHDFGGSVGRSRGLKDQVLKHGPNLLFAFYRPSLTLHGCAFNAAASSCLSKLEPGAGDSWVTRTEYRTA
ncbi:uncharacterized protein SPSK_01334 [Sporothrix schenckii 1099-18]|uniref:Uncharacterized protein n=1 Tax=Sporothrix schenckii 1099-18 TaxID=1397361 RepID=A0A0F2LXL2_SPOSC|nr:uncharacterized protein SPSK_01334 [Sporothrix schenckii 1099-18]KJR81235.1 hypothetical protein SPSK_01334 [Sporothrix schenckii 1099-18]